MLVAAEAVRADDSTLAFARRKSPGMRHRFSPLFISPFDPRYRLSRAKCHLRKSGRPPAFPNASSGPNRLPQPLASLINLKSNFNLVAEGRRQGDSLPDGTLAKAREKPMLRALR